MSRYTFHVVWVIITTAGFLTVLSGPLWGYPLSIIVAMAASICVAGYPASNSLRLMLGAFGALLIAGGFTGIAQLGVNPITVRGPIPFLLFGLACIWSALFPSSGILIDSRVADPSPSKEMDESPP